MAVVPASAEVPTAESVTLVTQTRVRPGKDGEFAAWQRRMNDTAAAAPGFLDHRVTEPAPPLHVDWVIAQRFRSLDDARVWLRSEVRQRLLAEVAPILAGSDDIHLFRGGPGGSPDGTVSAVISTRVQPGQEQAFRAWQRRIAAAEADFAGYQGSKLEPPVPGVSDEWATVVSFDSDEHMRTWLTSPQRQRLLAEARRFGAESRVLAVRTGFDAWFTLGRPGAAPPPAWKQNMVTLLVLYPIVFLWADWVMGPYMLDRGMPFWEALFIAKVVSVLLMSYLLMRPVTEALRWWLSPRADAPPWTNVAGAGLIVGLYAVFIAVFSQFP